MPAINVAKTDTFERQRQKINQIGDQIFNISQGGSDLSTGNLKLGDGTRTSPSLSFVSDPSLGLYKSSNNVIGYAASSKILADFGIDSLFAYKDFVLQKRIITDGGTSIQASGSNYDAGTYADISLSGGTGDLAKSNFTVIEFDGQLTNTGLNYLPGSYSNVPLRGGSGADSIISFTVDQIDGIVGNQGSGYVPGFYTSVPLTGGSGTGAEASVTITGTTTVTGGITNAGSSYTDGTYSNVELLNQPTQTFVVTAVTNPGTPPPNNVYNIDGNVQPVLNLIKGNTYAFDVSDSSLGTHPFIFKALSGSLNISNYVTITKGVTGTAGAVVYLIVKSSAPTETIQYDCSVHAGMGANINITTGAAGSQGAGLRATIEISGGAVTAVQIDATGSEYLANQVLSVYSGDVGGSGSGFAYTINSIAYDGVVDTFVVTNSGQNYVKTDTLSFNNSSTGNNGSGFSFEITTDPGIIKDLTFSIRGSGNQVGNQLTLPIEVTGVTGTLNSLSSTFSVSSVAGLVAGMTVTQTAGTGTLGSGITLASVDTINTTVTLSSAPEADGSATLTFTPEYGTPTTAMVYTVNVLGSISDYNISNGGNGYTNGDVLTVDPSALTQPIVYDVTVENTQDITLTGTVPSSSFSVGDVIKIRDGEVSALFVSGSTSIVAEEGNTYTGLSPTGGNGSGLVVDIERAIGGSAGTVTITNGGIDYQLNDTVTIAGTLVGGTSPTDDIELTLSTVSSNTSSEVYAKTESGGAITSLTCKYVDSGFSSSDVIIKVGTSTTATINTAASEEFRYFINTGVGSAQITPDLTLYVGNKYRFSTTNSSNGGHQFSLSAFRDGSWSPSRVENVSTVFTQGDKNLTVTSTTGILAGMEVTVVSGGGVLPPNTYVDTVVNSTTLTLTNAPTAAGASVVNFTGVAYTDGVTRSSDYVEIAVTDNTPTLYFYCPTHQNMGGSDNNEAVLTIDPNNPKTFGSGFELLVTSITQQNIVESNVLTGEVSAVSFTGSSASISSVSGSSLTYSDGTIDTLTTTNINSSALTITAPVTLDGNLDIGTTISIAESSGNITTSGVIKTTNSLNVSDVLTITNSVIETSGPNDITLTPFSGRQVKINSVTSLDIPVGTTLERPSAAANGSIRFNTTNGQYEGYNASTTSWSSLGGVRDLDGNTFILAELTPGANDNTLWFYNDSINTLKVTPEFLDFRTVKKISSGRLGIPAFSVWNSNTPVTVGQYLKYRNNLYEVTGAGTTASSGNEPTHTSGALNNGTAQLTWSQLAVSPLEFTEVEELRVGPNKDCPLVVSEEIKLFNNVISTLVEDLIVSPNAGKKVTIDAPTSLVIPVGNINQRGTALQGSIRYNTTISQFEGYSGSNWSSLGGVRDVDGNTYIIPETAPAANENILYFYNNNVNTIQLTETVLDFTNIDTITTTGGTSLALDTETLTLNTNDTTIDNSDGTRTFISTSKQYLDIGLSSGLNVDPVLRLDNQGDVYLNTTFGTGNFNGVKVLDGQLKEFELADYKVKTGTFQLVKGGSESSSVVLYDSATTKGCKVSVVSKSSSGKRSFSEYSVIDNGADIFHNEYGSLNTSGNDQFTAAFDFTASTEPRITLTLTNDHTTSDIINFTVLVQELK